MLCELIQAGKTQVHILHTGSDAQIMKLALFSNLGPDNLSILHAELHEVVNWFTFGQALLVPENQLHIINRDNPHNTEMCRSTMLDWWWNNADDHERKWLTIVQALAQTGSRRIAVRIAIKYGMDCSSLHAL